jgi:hypothetical protein
MHKEQINQVQLLVDRIVDKKKKLLSILNSSLKKHKKLKHKAIGTHS